MTTFPNTFDLPTSDEVADLFRDEWDDAIDASISQDDAAIS